MSSKNYVYILILNYNAYVKTIDCVNSILNSNYKNYKIIIIDNNSSDTSFDYFTKWINLNNFNSIELIRNDKNGGYAYGNNKAIKIIQHYNDCKYIWILNNDTLIDENALSELINSYDNDKQTIYGSKVINFKDSQKLSIVL